MKSQTGMRLSGSVSASALRLVRLVVLSLTLAGCLAMPATSHGAAERELVVGSEVDYPPFALGEAGGEPDGFTVELWKAVAIEMGFKYRFRVQPFNEILGDFRAGKIDVLINLAYSSERAQFANFSAPHVVSYGTIFARTGSLRFDSEEDLKGKSIIVLSGDLLHDYAVAAGYRDLVLVKDVAAGMRLLNEGKHDAMLISRLAGLQTLKQISLKSIEPVGAPIRGVVQRFGFAVRDGDSDLLAQINEGMAIVRMNGTYQRLYEKWFGAIDPRPVAPIEVARILAPAVLIIFLIGLAYFYQRRMNASLAVRVAERTSELTATLHSLRESEARFRCLSEMSSDFYWESDAEHRITQRTESSREAADLVFRRESIIGVLRWDVPHHSPDEAGWAAHRALLDAHLPFRDFEISRYGSNKTLTHVSVSGDPMFDEAGSFKGYRGVGIDITTRKQAEEALRESERRMDFALNGASLGMWDVDILSGRFVHNRQLMDMLGYLPGEKEVSINTLMSLLNREDASRLGMAYYAHLKGDIEDFEAEYRLRHKDGRWVWLLSRGKVAERDESGRAVRFCGTNLDITWRRQAEAELEAHRNHLEELVFARTAELAQARDDAEAANRAKSIFLANMSHELRTPMNGVMGMIDLVLRRATDPQQIDWLNKSKGSARHLLSVINDILDISRMEAEQLTLDENDFSLSQVMDDALRTQDETSRAKGLSLSGTIDPALPDLLCGDAPRLGQVLTNFIGNAVKFSERGQITVRARATEEDSHSVLLRIEVSDQGIGISPDERTRLFQAFTQADGSFTRKQGGTGLGLIISKRIANLMGGDTGVSSQEGHGSTFWVTVRLKRATDVPQAEASQSGEPPREALARLFPGVRVLVAEDEPINREVIMYLLEDAGLAPEAANNGQEAVGMALGGGYALILMDVQMPVMNGLEATRAIRQMPAMAALPILALTANAFDEDRKVCLAAGMDDHIGKPVEPDALHATVLHWLQKSVHAVAERRSPVSPYGI